MLGKVDPLESGGFHRRPRGHVTSLAVMRDYRRLGLGNELMTQVREGGGGGAVRGGDVFGGCG